MVTKIWYSILCQTMKLSYGAWQRLVQTPCLTELSLCCLRKRLPLNALMFTAMFSWKREKKANQAGTMSGKHEINDGTSGAVNPWVARSSNASSVRHSA